MPRHDGRQANELRPLTYQRGFTKVAGGSVLAKAGETTLLCTASVDEEVPPWLEGKGKGWITAEYSMLPGSTQPRKRRERAKVEGRTAEIQRLIGRSLRAVADLSALDGYTITVDCDVLQADGGTRTLAINAAFVALVDACSTLVDTKLRDVLQQSVAAISVGIVGGEPLLDLCYVEDSTAEVDMNVVMTGKGQFIELQGTGEQTTFNSTQLAQMLEIAQAGVAQITNVQREVLAGDWSWA